MYSAANITMSEQMWCSCIESGCGYNEYHYSEIGERNGSMFAGGVCNDSYMFMRQLLVRLNLTEPCCLDIGPECQPHKIQTSTSRRTAPAKGKFKYVGVVSDIHTHSVSLA